jgi:hypothetical protein
MKLEKICILVFIFLGIFLFPGCGQMVRLYSGPELPSDRVATLMVPRNAVQLKIDGKPVEWKRKTKWNSTEVSLGANRIDIQMLPGSYKIEWSWTDYIINFKYYGSGTLDAEEGKKYEINFAYLAESREQWDLHTVLIKVKDYATWIAQINPPYKVVVGNRPEWVSRGHIW